MRKTIAKIASLLGAAFVTLTTLVTPGQARHHREQEEQNVLRAPDMQAIDAAIKKLEFYAIEPDEYFIIIDPSRQELYLMLDHAIIKTYKVGTSMYGLGTKYGSNQTPYGTHRIREKIGAGEPPFTLFHEQKSTGEIRKHGGGITSRIMWLGGQEAGINADPRVNNDNFDKLPGHVDTFYRDIYIHGTPREIVGRPASIGCITMRNADVIELFDIVPVDTVVEILNKPYQEAGGEDE